MGIPVFPRKGEPWFGCDICSFAYPLSEAHTHYLTGLLVCFRCDDEPTHSDYLALTPRPMERTDTTPQKVQS